MSDNTSMLQRLMHLTSTLGTAFEQMVDAAKAQATNAQAEKTQAENAQAETSGEAKSGVTRKSSFSARTLDGGDLSDLTELANLLKAKAQAQAPITVRRTLQTEVFEETKHVVVLINEPSLQVSNLVVAIDDDMLELSAAQDGTDFVGEVFLPCAVNANTQSILARAGMLELRWEKQLTKKKKLRKPNAKPASDAGPSTRPSEQ